MKKYRIFTTYGHGDRKTRFFEVNGEVSIKYAKDSNFIWKSISYESRNNKYQTTIYRMYMKMKSSEWKVKE